VSFGTGYGHRSSQVPLAVGEAAERRGDASECRGILHVTGGGFIVLKPACQLVGVSQDLLRGSRHQ